MTYNLDKRGDIVTFGHRLKALREGKGLRQKDLAIIINVHRATIGKYETNERFPDKKTLEEIANYFDVSIDYLFGRVNIKNPAKEIEKIIATNDNYKFDLEGLPEEAIRQIEEYIEFIRSKYNSDLESKKK